MSVAISQSDPDELAIPLARSKGDLKIRVETDGLKDLYQSGSAKARFPNTYGEPFTGVLINTSGGLTGGDELNQLIEVGEEAQACITSQAAERLYHRFQGQAKIRTHLEVEAKAYLEWLPQESIVFDQSGLVRHTEIDLAEGAELLALESFVFGREAYGETVEACYLQDHWKIRREGRLIWADSFRLWGDVEDRLEHAASLNDCRGAATLVYVGAQAEELLPLVRELFEERRTEGATRMDDLLLIRVLGQSAAEMRERLEVIITAMREHIHGTRLPMPRTWHC